MWWIRSRTYSRKRLSYCRTDSHEWAPRISQDPVEHAYTALGHGRPVNITSTSHGNTTAEGPLLMLVVRMCVRNHISISSTTTHPISLWIHQLTYTKLSWTQIRLFITPHMYIHGLLFRGHQISIHCNGKIKPNMWRKLNHTTCLTHENQLNVFLHVYPGEISLKISNKMFW